MKVAYAINRFPEPSQTFVSREVLALQASGCDLEVYSLAPVSAEARSRLTPQTRALIEPTHYLGTGETIASMAGNAGRALALWQQRGALYRQFATRREKWPLLFARGIALGAAVARSGAERLHAHWPYSSKVAAIASDLTGIPLSISIHAHEVRHENQHFPYLFDRLDFACFCNRAAMEELLGQLNPSARDRAHLIYHGVDVEQFRLLPVPPRGPDDPIAILSAGRLTPTKGFDRLIRGCARASAAGIPVELTVLGSSSSGLADELRSLADALGFGERLHLPGWVPHDRVGEYLQASHLFALLADTNFHDGLPNVVLEAMASGRAAIVSPLPAAAEAIADGQEGFVLAAADDEDGFVRALEAIAAGKCDLAQMGRAARERAVREFDEKVHIRQLYQLLTGDRHPSVPQKLLER